MFPNTPNEKFVFGKLLEPMPGWALLVPVLFALAVVVLVVLFRRERRLLALGIGSGVVLALAVPYLGLGWLFRQTAGWWLVLTPVLAVALFYVALMYKRDAQTINPVLAAFLGLLRVCVYAILAFVFLRPGIQHYRTTETVPVFV